MGEPWFGAKQYGLGLSPRSPAGWAALGVYVVAVIAARWAFTHFGGPVWALWVAIGVLTIGFLVLTVIKSDRKPWRWRWGGQ